MAAVSVKGKLFSYLFFYALAFSLSSSSVLAVLGSDPVIIPPLNTNTNTTELNATEVLSRQQVQLDKLELIVRNLSQLVSRLESNSGVTPNPPNVVPYPDRVDRSYNNDQSTQFVEKIRVVDSSNNPNPNPPGAVSVTRHNPFWSERFQFVSAVKLQSNATCINILPFKDFDGLSKYIAVGNELGKVYVILRNGEVLIDFNTTSDSPVTSMLSYISVGKNETVLITGHKNGLIHVHRVFEASTVEEWSSLSMNNVAKFDSPPEIAAAGGVGQEINILELHYVGRTKYILSTDVSGAIRVFRENGTVYGSAVPTSKPLAFLKQRLLFLTETGAGSIDLRSMKIKENECEGLNYSSPAVSYTFDSTDRSKAYGLTTDGDLIHIMLLGDVLNFKCRARVSKRKIDTIKPIALQAIRGYLLVVNPDKVFVYNISSQHYVRSGGLRLLFAAGIDEVRYSFPHFDINDTRNSIPLIASDREKMVVLSLGGGYVGTFRSNLPVAKQESNNILWMSPVLFFVLFLFAAWYCFAKKKEALTSWGPDDPFTTTQVNFADSNSSSRGEGGGIRGGSSRRFASPTRFSSGTVSPFRSGSGENGSRPGGPVNDPNLGPRTGELKFRGANMESSGLQKRRESLYGHNQVAENKD